MNSVIEVFSMFLIAGIFFGLVYYFELDQWYIVLTPLEDKKQKEKDHEKKK